MADVRAQADTAIDAFLPVLASKQAAYLARAGRYWQGVETHPITPVGGVSSPPVLVRRPTDQAESWADEGYSVPSRSFSFEVHVYDGPLGRGYELIARFRDAGGLWIRRVNIGPETYRNRPWEFEL